MLSPEDVASGNLLHNRILRERAAESLTYGYGNKWRTLTQSSKVGFFDGQKIISVATRPVDKSDWGEWLGRLFNYGASVWRARKLPIGTMDDFQRLLNLDGIYGDVGEMLAASENLGLVSRSALERLKLNGLSQKYVHDVLGPQVKRHTSQSVERVSDLAMSMALDREDQGIQTFEVGGRLTTLLGDFIIKSKAVLKLNAKVTGLRREMVEGEKDSWILEYSESKSQTQATYEAFDKVIIATPWKPDTPQFNLPGNANQIQYRSQWMMFFITNSTLDTSYFGNPSTLPEQIVPVPNSQLMDPIRAVQEIAHLKEIPDFDLLGGEYRPLHLYRIFSTQQIEMSSIHPLFGAPIFAYHQEEIVDAYPCLYARSNGFPGFKISEDLWHTSVIEAIGSSVDLSWVTGENVARLVGREVEKQRK